MIKVYKLPQGVNIDTIRQLKGLEGSYLNPIQDINDNWIVSVEEWEANEFQYLKTDYPDIVNQMVLIDYEPKPQPNPFENA